MMDWFIYFFIFAFGVIVGGAYEANRSQRVIKKYGKWVPYDY
jgi:hypothetical protein